MAIATVSTWDWPHAWPALTGLLIGALRDRASEDAVNGALRCLAMIAGDLEETGGGDVRVLFPESTPSWTRPPPRWASSAARWR